MGKRTEYSICFDKVYNAISPLPLSLQASVLNSVLNHISYLSQKTRRYEFEGESIGLESSGGTYSDSDIGS